MKFKRGFTLIELLVVIAIIGILSAVTVPNIVDATARARNAGRMANLASLETALMQYKEDNGGFPSTGGNYWCAGGTFSFCSRDYEGSNGYIPNLAPQYIRRLPADPMLGKPNPVTGGYNAGYFYVSNGTDFKVFIWNAPENPGSHLCVVLDAGGNCAGDPSFQYYNPARPGYTWAIYSPGARDW